MTSGNSATLAALAELNKHDAALARVLAERKKFQQALKDKGAQLKQIETSCLTQGKVIADKRARYQKEEKLLKEEQEKLTLRRKAMGAVGNYKVQQAAQREVEHAGRQLSAKEELLIQVLADLDTLEGQLNKDKETLTKLQLEYLDIEKESQDASVGLDEREKRHQEDRAKIAATVDASALSVYNKIKERFPLDAVMPVKNLTCSGCFMQLGPQVVVQISRGEGIQRCRGCGRILCLSEEEQSKEVVAK